MENKIIVINKTKEEILALPDNSKIDLLGAIKEINDNYEKDIKKSLIVKGDSKIVGDYFVATVAAPNEGKPKIEPIWEKIIAVAQEQKYEIPMTIDYKKLAEMEWVKTLLKDASFFKVVNGRPFPGSVTIKAKKGE